MRRYHDILHGRRKIDKRNIVLSSRKSRRARPVVSLPPPLTAALLPGGDGTNSRWGGKTRRRFEKTRSDLVFPRSDFVGSRSDLVFPLSVRSFPASLAKDFTVYVTERLITIAQIAFFSCKSMIITQINLLLLL